MQASSVTPLAALEAQEPGAFDSASVQSGRGAGVDEEGFLLLEQAFPTQKDVAIRQGRHLEEVVLTSTSFAHPLMFSLQSRACCCERA